MGIGWKRMLPIALANVLITAFFIILAEEGILSFERLLSVFGF
jgi:hypothetical protein